VFVRPGADVFRTVIGSYEDRQNMLMSENGDLRNALRDLQKQLIAMLHCDDGHSTADQSAEVRCEQFALAVGLVYFAAPFRCRNYLHRFQDNVVHLIFGHNLCKCRPIFTVLLPSDSQGHCLCTFLEISISLELRCYTIL